MPTNWDNIVDIAIPDIPNGKNNLIPKIFPEINIGFNSIFNKSLIVK